MSKLRPKSPKQPTLQPSKSRQATAANAPLRGIERIAFWSVPAVGLIAVICASFLGYKLLNQSATVADAEKSKTGNIARVSAKKPSTKEDIKKRSSQFSSKSSKNADASAPTESGKNKQTNNSTVKVAAISNRSAQTEPTTVMSLRCKQDGIEFSGAGQISFFENAPNLELIEDEGTSLASISFNGEDQSIELPSAPKDEGSVSIVVKMPTGETSIFLDSSAQRLTLRKNRDGLRWRVAGMNKPAKIRLVQQRVDFRRWHHLVVSWKSQDEAKLYVDGVLSDEYPYFNENQSPTFDKVVLGRTRGPNSKFYNCNVAEFKVLNFALNQSQVEKLHQSVLESYSHFLSANN